MFSAQLFFLIAVFICSSVCVITCPVDIKYWRIAAKSFAADSYLPSLFTAKHRAKQERLYTVAGHTVINQKIAGENRAAMAKLDKISRLSFVLSSNKRYAISSQPLPIAPFGKGYCVFGNFTQIISVIGNHIHNIA